MFIVVNLKNTERRLSLHRTITSAHLACSFSRVFARGWDSGYTWGLFHVKHALCHWAAFFE